MLPTLREVLDLPVLRAGAPELICAGSLDRLVRWVHVSEVADLANLLEGDELVLTTGLALADAGRRDDYLPGLAAAGAAGVVIELGRHLPAVPRSVVRSGDGLGLPVVVLHEQVRFVEVTEQVHRRIVAEQYAEVDHARRVHEAFTALNMSRASLDQILQRAAEIIDAPLVLEDLNRQVLAFVARGVPTTQLLADWDRRSRLTPDEGPDGWLSRPVGPFRQEWGRLVAPTVQPDDGTAARTVTTLERAAQALALHRMVQQDRTSLELRAQSGLVDDLRHGRVRDEAEAASRAYALGVRPALTYVPMAVRLRESVRNDQVVMAQRRARTLDAVVHAIRAAGHTVLATSRDDGQIDLLLAPRTGTPPHADDAALDAVCTDIRSAVTRVDGIVDGVIGLGPKSALLMDAANGLAEAGHVAEVALALPDTGRACYRAADVRLRGLLALIRSDPRVQAFAETELRPLLEHRAKHGDELYDLLAEYLATGGNKTVLAQRLHLSRPTLYARLAVLGRLLGVDLDDAESRTSLHVAMLILQKR